MHAYKLQHDQTSRWSEAALKTIKSKITQFPYNIVRSEAYIPYMLPYYIIAQKQACRKFCYMKILVSIATCRLITLQWNEQRLKNRYIWRLIVTSSFREHFDYIPIKWYMILQQSIVFPVPCSMLYECSPRRQISYMDCI
jgi:hypothetical protein